MRGIRQYNIEGMRNVLKCRKEIDLPGPLYFSVGANDPQKRDEGHRCVYPGLGSSKAAIASVCTLFAAHTAGVLATGSSGV